MIKFGAAKFLLIDNNEDDQIAFVELMQQAGFKDTQIDTVSSVMEIKDFEYDFIFCEISISYHPDSLKTLRNRNPLAIIILLTGLNQSDLTGKAIKAGAQDFLIKEETNVLELKKTLYFANERFKLLRGLQQNEIRFRKLIENNHDAIIIQDEETVISYASPSIQSMLGYKPKELINKKVIDFLHPDDLAQGAMIFSRLLQGQDKVVNIKERALHKRGHYIWIYASISDRRGIPGINGIVANFKNIDGEEKAREQVSQSEKKLANITNAIPGAVFQFRYNPKKNKYKVEFLSNGVESITGFRSKDYSNDLFNLLKTHTSEKDYKFLVNEIKKSTQNASPLKLEFRIKHKSGNIRWAKADATPIKDQKNGSIIWNGIITDITDQVKTRTENEELAANLKKSNELFRFAARITSDVILDWNLITNEFHWGRSFEKLFGHELSSGSNSLFSWSKFIHPEDRPSVLHSIHESVNGQADQWQEEFRYLKSDGYYATVRCKAIVVEDENGNKHRMIGAMQDITLQKKEEQHLKLLESVITHTQNSVLISEATLLNEFGPKIMYVNQAFIDMTGYSEHELIGQSIDKLVGINSDHEKLIELKENFKNVQIFEIETILYKKNGKEFWVNINFVPVNDNSGKNTHWIAIARDITVRKVKEIENQVLINLGHALGINNSASSTLKNFTKILNQYLDFDIAELWLTHIDNNQVALSAYYSKNEECKAFVNTSKKLHFTKKDAGLQGNVWKSKKILQWDNLASNKQILRKEFAKKHGLNSAVGIPLFFNAEVIGVLLLFSKEPQADFSGKAEFFNRVSQLGSELHRVKLEDELNRFYNLSPDILCISNFDGYMKKVNPAVTNILGFSEAEIKAKPIIEFVHEKDRDKTKKATLELLNNKYSFFENRCICKDGSIKWISWTAIASAEDKLIYAVAKNLTGKKNLEKQKEKILSNITDGFFEVNHNSIFTYWNKTAEKTLQKTSNQIIGKNLWDEYNYLKDSVFAEEYHLAKEKRVHREFTFYLQSLDIWLTFSIHPIEKGLAVYFKDISKDKQHEQEILRIKNNREALINSTDDLIWSVNKDLKLISANKSFIKHLEKLFNARIKEGDPIINNDFDDKFNQKWQGYYQKAVSGESFSVTEEIVLENRLIYSQISFHPILNNQNECIGTACFARDITERITHIKAIEDQNQRLRDIAWTQSHSFRGPLARLKGLLNLLEMEKLTKSAKIREILRLIYVSTDELDAITNEIVNKTDKFDYKHDDFIML